MEHAQCVGRRSDPRPVTQVHQANVTVIDTLRARAARFAERIALRHDRRTCSYAELFDRVDRLSHVFAALGIAQGDRVLAFVGNCPEALECEFAALQSGIAWITLNSRLTWPEARGVVQACRPKLLIVDASTASKATGGVATLPAELVPRIVAIDGTGTSGDGTPDAPHDYEALLASHPPRRPRVSISPEDVARLRYTSGTTGTAKAAVLPHRVYESSLETLLAELGPLGPDTCTLHVAPLTHGGGALAYPTLYAGGTNLLVPHFDADAALELIERHRVTTAFTVPTILSRLLAAPSFGDRNLTSLRHLIYGGAPMPEAQLLRAVDRVGHALVHIYGMTEAPWPITLLPQSEHRRGNPRLRSIGRPTRQCELRLVDDTGLELGPGVVGEIQIRGRNVMTGYYQDEAATREVLRNGWLSTGDLAMRDEDGYYTIVDRKKDVIISGGFNVYAKEVEMALCEDPRILEAAVVGVPHADWGEQVVAWVVPAPGASLTPADVDAFAHRRLSGYKCPRRIEIHESLPKNPNGKIRKPEIRERLTQEGSRGDEA